MTNPNFNGKGIEATLLNEDIDTSKALPRIGGKFIEQIAKAVFDGVKVIVDAPKNRGVYASTLTYGIPQINDGYTTSTTLHNDYIASAPASQNWLKKVTGKHGSYVAGAAVLDGEDEGTYIDSTLIEGAKRYLVNYSNGDLEEAGMYAVHFVEAVTTDRHERDAHYELRILNENAAEAYAEKKIAELARQDPVVGFAYKIAA